MLTTDYKITELFCVIDDFCKHFEAENGGELLLGDDNTKRRRRKDSLSGSEIMTILLYFHFGKFCIFKHYYLFFLSSRLLSRTSLTLSLTTVLLNLNVRCFSFLCSFLICVHLEDVQVLHLLTQQ